MLVHIRRRTKTYPHFDGGGHSCVFDGGAMAPSAFSMGAMAPPAPPCADALDSMPTILRLSSTAVFDDPSLMLASEPAESQNTLTLLSSSKTSPSSSLVIRLTCSTRRVLDEFEMHTTPIYKKRQTFIEHKMNKSHLQYTNVFNSNYFIHFTSVSAR